MKRIKIGIIPAAGKGRRINDLPLTRILPKPMLPILDKPLLEYVLLNMRSIGVEEVYIINGPKKEIIQEYFGNGQDFNLKIRYLDQIIPQGIAQAIGLVKDYVNEPFTVILGDDLTIVKSFKNLIETFWGKNALVVEGIVPENNFDVLKRTCCIELDSNGAISKITEKPSMPKTNLRGIGVYLFDPKVFDFIQLTPISCIRGEKEISDTIDLMAKEGKAYGAVINGVNINVNTRYDLREATKMLLKIQEMQPPN